MQRQPPPLNHENAKIETVTPNAIYGTINAPAADPKERPNQTVSRTGRTNRTLFTTLPGISIAFVRSSLIAM